jgi:hypothetical protein
MVNQQRIGNFLKSFIFLSIFLVSTISIAQSKTDDFFAQKENEFIKAYKEKDTTQYLGLMNSFLDFYEKLNQSNIEKYKNHKTNAYYNLCCTYAVLNDKENAGIYLKKSLESGFKNYSQLISDTDLNSIREENSYLESVASLRSIFDYLYVLSKDDNYDKTNQSVTDPFVYQSESDKNLRKLRYKYNLDSVAGTGAEIEKLKNILFWVHKKCPHNGDLKNPKIKNTLNFLNKCEQTNQGLNCRGLALVLNECYLSMGYKSRVVCCIPKDSLNIDDDCHVLTTVYSEDLKKWIWLDPTMNSIIYNQSGEILGVAEVRKALIAGDSLILNSEANWNGAKVDINQYLYQYMAKNLYYLECPIKSEFNFETRKLFKKYHFVKLSPTNYLAKSARKFESKSVFFTRNISHITTNDDLFWSAP